MWEDDGGTLTCSLRFLAGRVGSFEKEGISRKSDVGRKGMLVEVKTGEVHRRVGPHRSFLEKDCRCPQGKRGERSKEINNVIEQKKCCNKVKPSRTWSLGLTTGQKPA